jgi:nitrilase
MTSGRRLEDNLAQASRLLEAASARGAALVVLPENFAYMGAADSERLDAAERWGEGPIQSFLQHQAIAHQLWLVGGTVPIWDDASRARSASLLFDPAGRTRARYDKIHLFDVGIPSSEESYRESATTVAGTEALSVDTPLGRIGMAVCYDIRFPALFERLGAMGMDMLVFPAAFTVPTGEAHWSVLLRARAIESLSYVIAAAQWGEHEGGRRTYGHSMIVDPWGEILAERAERPGVVMADLDMMRLERLRESFPALQHRHRF